MSWSFLLLTNHLCSLKHKLQWWNYTISSSALELLLPEQTWAASQSPHGAFLLLCQMTAGTAEALAAQPPRHFQLSIFSAPNLPGSCREPQETQFSTIQVATQSVRGFSFTHTAGRNLLCIKVVVQWDFETIIKKLASFPHFLHYLEHLDSVDMQSWWQLLMSGVDFSIKMTRPFISLKAPKFVDWNFDKVLLFSCTQKKSQVLT